jgi:hypothetical protein
MTLTTKSLLMAVGAVASWVEIRMTRSQAGGFRMPFNELVVGFQDSPDEGSQG